ncbi:MAG TPA: hypothetical protein VGH02_12990 [Rhizomicrobium sp.]
MKSTEWSKERAENGVSLAVSLAGSEYSEASEENEREKEGIGPGRLPKTGVAPAALEPVWPSPIVRNKSLSRSVPASPI